MQERDRLLFRRRSAQTLTRIKWELGRTDRVSDLHDAAATRLMPPVMCWQLIDDPADVCQRDHGRDTEQGRSDSRSRFYEEIKAVPFKDRLRCLGLQERKISHSIRFGICS